MSIDGLFIDVGSNGHVNVSFGRRSDICRRRAAYSMVR